jgi:hypothetical protein
VSKNLDVQGILTEVRSDIECIVMAARQLPPEEGGPIGALADAAGKKSRKRFVSWEPKSRQATARRRDRSGAHPPSLSHLEASRAVLGLGGCGKGESGIQKAPDPAA